VAVGGELAEELLLSELLFELFFPPLEGSSSMVLQREGLSWPLAREELFIRQVG
jgi:hypothetical protein